MSLNNNERPKPRPLTYRVQEIPGNWNKQQLRDVFPQVDQPYISVKSLVPDVMNYGYQNDDGTDTLTATLLFSPPESKDLTLGENCPADLELDKDFSGFTPLNDPGRDVVGDVIAVTGLAGHAYGSWANSPDRMWLRDFLPSTIPNARILIYGYRALVEGSNQPKSILTDHADTFMNDLLTIRNNPACQDRPLILIGHSLGGLIIKEFITNLEEEVRHRLPIRSLVFFGVPHLGLETNGTLASMVKGQPSQILVNELNRDSPTITSLTKRFMRVLKDAPFTIHSLYESQATKTVTKNEAGDWVREGASVVMVPYSSAVLRHEREKHTLSVQGDHSSMVKLRKGQGSCYPSVSQWIKEDLKTATEVFNGLQVKMQDLQLSESHGVEHTEPPPQYNVLNAINFKPLHEARSDSFPTLKGSTVEQSPIERPLSPPVRYPTELQPEMIRSHTLDDSQIDTSDRQQLIAKPPDLQESTSIERHSANSSLMESETEVASSTNGFMSTKDVVWPNIKYTGPWIGHYDMKDNSLVNKCNVCFEKIETEGNWMRCLICHDFDFHKSCIKESYDTKGSTNSGSHKPNHGFYNVQYSLRAVIPVPLSPSGTELSCIPIVTKGTSIFFFLLTNIVPAKYSVIVFVSNFYNSLWHNIRDSGFPSGEIGVPKDLDSFLKVVSSDDINSEYDRDELFSYWLPLRRRHRLDTEKIRNDRYALDPGPGQTIITGPSGVLAVYIELDNYSISKTSNEGFRINSVRLYHADDNTPIA